MVLLRNLLLIALMGAALIACQDKSNDNNDSFQLSGVVHGTSDTTAFFYIQDSSYTIHLVNDSFSFELPLKENTIGNFSVGLTKLELLAIPNEDLFLTINNNNVSYKGGLADLHQQIKSIRNDHIEHDQFSNLRALYSLPQDSFNSLVFEAADQFKNALDTVVKKEDDSWKLKIWESNTNQLAKYALNYPLYHGRLTNNDTFEVKQAYFQRVRDAFSLEDLDLVAAEGRKEVLRKFVEVQVRLDTPSVTSDSVRLKLLFERTEASFDRDTLVDIIITQMIKDQIQYQGLGDAGDLIAEYISRMPDSKEKDEIEEKVAKWKQLETGKEAPDFTAQRIDSSKVSLSDLEGKVVYIDVWATWCGPCLREIPHLEKMYDRFSDREDVALLSVSIDSDYEKWYQKVTEDEMEGIQLWVKDAWDSNLNEKYMIKSIPRFILIDKKGRIVDADAPRPSSGEQIYSMIEAEL